MKSENALSKYNKITLILVLHLNSYLCFSLDHKDTIQKIPKNQFYIGYTFIDFMDGLGIKRDQLFSEYRYYPGFPSLTIEHRIAKTQFTVGVRHYKYQHNHFEEKGNELEADDAYEKLLRNTSLHLGYNKILKNRRWVLNYGISLNRRVGSESYFVSRYTFHSHITGWTFTSIGAGCRLKVDFNISRYIFVSGNSEITHYFNRIDEDQKIYYNGKMVFDPTYNQFVNQLSLGVRF